MTYVLVVIRCGLVFTWLMQAGRGRYIVTHD